MMLYRGTNLRSTNFLRDHSWVFKRSTETLNIEKLKNFLLWNIIAYFMEILSYRTPKRWPYSMFGIFF